MSFLFGKKDKNKKDEKNQQNNAEQEKYKK